MNLQFLPLRLPTTQPPTRTPTHASSTLFRTYLTRHSATSSKRILHIPSPHRLTATPQGGDCFFHALSWRLPFTPPPQHIRDTLCAHVRAQSLFYARALVARGFAPRGARAAALVHAFCESARVGGPQGHWLGALWGELEVLACARAFGVAIELFAFDVRKQVVRQYFRVGEGDVVVRLLFTGQAHAGHFDALLPVKTLRCGFSKWFVKRPGKRV